MAAEKTLQTACDAIGLTVDEARRLAQGGVPRTEAGALAAPALRHAYTGERSTSPSIPAAYEAGMRLLAHDTQMPVPRRITSGVFYWSEGHIIATKEKSGPLVLNGAQVDASALHGALYALVDHITIPPALYIDKSSTLTAITEQIGSLPNVEPRVHSLLALWVDASDHAGNGVCVDMSRALADMYAVGNEPGSLARWGRILGTDVEGLAGLIHAYSLPVPAMETSWVNRWGSLRRRADDGWMRPRESSADMMASMESMQNAGDWHFDYGLATDPLLQEAAIWSGHVVAGRWVSSTPSTWTFAAGGAPCRYRSSSEVALDLYSDGRARKTVNVEVRDIGYDPEFGVLITVHADGKPNNARELDRCFTATDGVDRTVVLARPRLPQAERAADAGMRAMQRRRAADQRSWFKDPNRRPRTDRHVPWDVYVAAVGG